MSRLKEKFPGRKSVFLIALHITPHHTDLVADLAVASSAGVDGIIVIKDYTTLATDDDTLSAYDYARKKYPDSWIGINLLDHRAEEAVTRARRGTSGIWIDNPRIDEEETDPVRYLKAVRMGMEVWYTPHPQPLLFPSIDFKYQKPAKNLERVAQLGAPFADALVTSGKATGEPADPEKIKRLRAATDCPIGLASGVSVENVEEYMRLGVDLFIVNTSISTNGRLDRNKVDALRQKIK